VEIYYKSTSTLSCSAYISRFSIAREPKARENHPATMVGLILFVIRSNSELYCLFLEVCSQLVGIILLFEGNLIRLGNVDSFTSCNFFVYYFFSDMYPFQCPFTNWSQECLFFLLERISFTSCYHHSTR
jgi:hypothetical protein